MRKTLSTLLFIAFLSSCLSFYCKEGNGILVKEKRDLVGFNQIELMAPGNLTIKKGDKWSVEVEADSNVISNVITELDGEELYLKIDGVCPTTLNFTIFMPMITELEVSGSGNATIMGKFKAEDLDLELDGSGDINVNSIEVGDLDIDINGSGDITLMGSAEEADVDISGSGDLNALEFEFEELDIEINGSGNASFTCNENLKMLINGSGSINYKGKPDLVQEINGSGEVTNIK